MHEVFRALTLALIICSNIEEDRKVVCDDLLFSEEVDDKKDLEAVVHSVIPLVKD